MERVPTDAEARILRTRGADATAAVGAAIAVAAHPLPAAGLLVGLHGDLGAGKTVLVKGIARGLGLPEDAHVVSPTFTIARSYEARGGVVLHHIDAYRLGSGGELEDVGFEDMCGPGRFTCVEWAERVADALPEDRIDAWIEMEDPEDEVEPGAVPQTPRRIRLVAGGGTSAGVLTRLACPAEGVECVR